mmetsp:Transcript_10649/g.23526  ORF Transcript_10649/g.23526 Transcript_10649/m.23526 type:complete len:500 (-) Transcript_10649:308-1807(-)
MDHKKKGLTNAEMKKCGFAYAKAWDLKSRAAFLTHVNSKKDKGPLSSWSSLIPGLQNIDPDKVRSILGRGNWLEEHWSREQKNEGWFNVDGESEDDGDKKPSSRNNVRHDYDRRAGAVSVSRDRYGHESIQDGLPHPDFFDDDDTTINTESGTIARARESEFVAEHPSGWAPVRKLRPRGSSASRDSAGTKRSHDDEGTPSGKRSRYIYRSSPSTSLQGSIKRASSARKQPLYHHPIMEIACDRIEHGAMQSVQSNLEDLTVQGSYEPAGRFANAKDTINSVKLSVFINMILSKDGAFANEFAKVKRTAQSKTFADALHYIEFLTKEKDGESLKDLQKFIDNESHDRKETIKTNQITFDRFNAIKSDAVCAHVLTAQNNQDEYNAKVQRADAELKEATTENNRQRDAILHDRDKNMRSLKQTIEEQQAELESVAILERSTLKITSTGIESLRRVLEGTDQEGANEGKKAVLEMQKVIASGDLDRMKTEILGWEFPVNDS